jgi:hypothetical protein
MLGRTSENIASDGVLADVTNIVRNGVQISALDKKTDNGGDYLPGSRQERRRGTREIRIDGSRIEGDRHNPLISVSSCEFVREQDSSLLRDQNLVLFTVGKRGLTNLL